MYSTSKQEAEQQKRKTAVPSEWRRNKTKLLRNTGHTYSTFKRGADILERKIVPLGGRLVDWDFFLSSPSVIDFIFSKYIGRWEISVPKKFGFCANLTLSKTRKSWKLLQNVQL
jgi:hypothetical protein